MRACCRRPLCAQTNHWNAIVTHDLKYVFRAFFPDEQLFNLTVRAQRPARLPVRPRTPPPRPPPPQEDPYEMHDVAAKPAYAAALAQLRGELVAQFEDEGRGPAWVKGGVLQRRVDGEVYSPNFPSGPPPVLQPLIPGPPCAAWLNTTGGYYRNAFGAEGQLGAFTNLKLGDALAWCCSSLACAGFDWAADPGSGLGSGYYKRNALGGWTDSTQYVGFYKPGQVPGY